MLPRGSICVVRSHRFCQLVVLVIVFQCCVLLRADIYPSKALRELETACANISELMRRSIVIWSGGCQPFIDHSGEAMCTCWEMPKNFRMCPEFKGRNRFAEGDMIVRRGGKERVCMYHQDDRKHCKIEWQDTWRCRRDWRGESMGFRKGILITSPGLHGYKCYDKYIGFTFCSEFGYCEQVMDRLCNLVTQSDYDLYYKPCNEFVYKVQNRLCENHTQHNNTWKPNCRATLFQTIICTPFISPSGSFQCQCKNPYKSMKASVEMLAQDDCPRISAEESEWGDFWQNGWRSLSQCLYTNSWAQSCKINWVGKFERGTFVSHRSFPQSCGQSDKENLTMIVGKIETPQSGDGLRCEEVYNTSIVCDGLWCVQICLAGVNHTDSLHMQETKACETYGEQQAEQLRLETNISDCWGCITRQDDGACIAAPFDGIRRCKCILLFNPDFLFQVTNDEFKNYTLGWLNGGHPKIEKQGQSKSVFFQTEGTRYVSFVGHSDASYVQSFFVTYYEAFDRSAVQLVIDWSSYECMDDGENTEVKRGNLTSLSGLDGYRTFHQEKDNLNINCTGYRCLQQRKNYILCKPLRRETVSKCRCEIGWKRHISKKYGDSPPCGEEYQGCCNLVGSEHSSTAGYCPFLKDSCIDGPPKDRPDMEDDCVPVVRGRNPCYPWWYLNKSSVCPYGRALLGDVTLPPNPGVTDIISVIYGYIPFVVAGFALLEFIIRRGTRSLSFILFVLFIVAMGEICFKRIVKQPRPALTCLHSCGMPSSHSSLSVGYFVIMFVDASWRQFNQEDSDSIRGRARSWTLVPILHSEAEVSPRKFIFWVGFWFCILVPVPVTRVLLWDHTSAQVLTGSLIGFCEALIWFGLMLKFERSAKNHFGEVRLGIKHDLVLTPRDSRFLRFDTDTIPTLDTEMTLPPMFPSEDNR